MTRRFAQIHPDGVCRHDGTRHRDDGSVDCPLLRPARPKHAVCGQCGGDDWREVMFCADCGESPEKIDPNWSVRAQRDELLAELRNIADAKPWTWDENMRDQFRQWAQSRARAAIIKADGK